MTLGSIRQHAQWAVERFLNFTSLCYFPVRVKVGVAKGARWTLFPWSAYWRGGFEVPLQQALIELGDLSGKSCWDLGAHYGLYSVGLARRVGPTGQVAAFEPNPLSYGRLERHRRMNELSWMKTFQSAVSDHAGSGEFYTYGRLESTETHLPFEGEIRSADCQPIAVSLVRLDDLVAKGVIRIPDLIKVDVEGHARKALEGARESIIKGRPVIVVAFHSTGEVEGTRAVLGPLGYTCKRVETTSEDASDVIGHDFIFRPDSR